MEPASHHSRIRKVMANLRKIQTVIQYIDPLVPPSEAASKLIRGSSDKSDCW